MFAAALTRRAYLPCGSVLYSVRLGCVRVGGARSTAAPLHLERSVSRLPNCLNSGEGVSRDVSDPRYSYMRALGPTPPHSVIARTDVLHGWISMRISRHESIRFTRKSERKSAGGKRKRER